MVPYAELKFEHLIILGLVEDKLPADVEKLPIHTPEVKELLTKCWSISPSQRPSALQCLSYMRPAMRSQSFDSSGAEDLELSDFSSNVAYPRLPKHSSRKGTADSKPQKNAKSRSRGVGSPFQLVGTVTSRPLLEACIVPGPQMSTARTAQSSPSVAPLAEVEIPINHHVSHSVASMQTAVNRQELGIEKAGVENVSE